MTQEQKRYIVEKLALLNDIDNKLIEEDSDNEYYILENIKKRSVIIASIGDGSINDLDVRIQYKNAILEYRKYEKNHKNTLKLVKS